jgi:DNA-binding CsgD family transcriptional regulator
MSQALPNSPIAQFSKYTATLLEKVGSDEFPELMVAMLKAMVTVNDATIVVYPDTLAPVIDYFDTPEEGGSHNLTVFLQGAFLLDPFYLAYAADKKQGFYSLKELAPSAFKTTEYYNTYQRISGIHDECGYLIPTGGDGFVNISLNRTTLARNFYQKELKLLKDIEPMVTQLARQHWLSSAKPMVKGHKNLRKPLQSALDDFGGSVLTGRECQVINKVLQGQSTKAIARKLTIANETVKLHKKHAYAKLDINSQSELFHLFLDSLMSIDNYTGGDTLDYYLNHTTLANKNV